MYFSQRLCAILSILVVCVLMCSCNHDTARSKAPSDEPLMPKKTECIATVVLDAGHGGFDGGAVGIQSKVPEAAINLAVAKETASLLTQNGVRVVMTRENDDALAENKKGDMAKRKEIMNDSGADLVVSIHMNKFTNRSVNGPMVFYMKGSQPGKLLADALIAKICDALTMPHRLSNPGDYFIVRESTVPAVIVECGFLSNSHDEELLLTKSYQQLLAKAIADGILEFINSVNLH